MKRSRFFQGSCVLALALFSAAGCASLGGGAKTEPGTLTLTGIPAEYEGKFFLASLYSTDPKVQSLRANPVRSLGTAVSDGKVQLPLYAAMKLLPTVYNSGYAGSDTFRVRLLVSDTLQEPSEIAKPDFILDSVKFENGSAETGFDMVLKPVSITITGIHQNWQDTPITARIGVSRAGSVVKDGTATIKLFFKDEAGNYITYAGSGTEKITGSLGDYNPFTFDDVDISSGEVVLDIWQGFDGK